MYVCLCRGITEADIHSAMESGSKTLEELQDILGVATCCGCCRRHAEGMLQYFWKPQGADDVPRWEAAVIC